MANHRERRRLPYPPEKIYALVADVERYPEFIPWVERIRILDRKPAGEEGAEKVRAEMAVRFKIFRERFMTEVHLEPAAPRITVQYLDGPFRYLENRWDFHIESDGATLVDFYIDYEFKRGPLQLLARTFQSEAVFRLVRAFVARAHALYGVGERAKA